MKAQDSTSWTLLYAAAAGGEGPRAEFVARYAPVVRAYLTARWRNATQLQDLDDAVQEVFLQCLKPDGLLERVRADQQGGFRAFLYGAVRNVALQAETRQARSLKRESPNVDLEDIANSDNTLSQVFDRAWAKAVVREASERQLILAARRGEASLRRVELLKLRFQEGLPIRDIAQRWGVEAAYLHHEYARAREEFRLALREVIASYHSESVANIDSKCAELLSLFE